MSKIEQSFIFAAGRGSRMAPITDKIPKPLVKIKNKAIIDYIIEKIDEIGEIDKIIVNGFYLAGQVANHIKNLENSKIIFSKEQEKIETGGGLLFAVKNKLFDTQKPILCANGDVIWQGKGDIEKICNAHQSDCDILLGLTKTENFLGYQGEGDFNLAPNGDLIFGGEYTFIGLQIVNPKILQHAPSNSFSMGYFYKNAKNLGIKIKGIELDAKFFHIGDVNAISLVESVL